MKQYILLVFIVIIAVKSMAQNKDEQTINAILQAQEKQWNLGNLDAFMKGYWQNDSLIFIGSKGPKYGYNNTLQNYKKSYPDTTHMGHFTSTIISTKRLSTDYYFVVGKWYLQRSVGNIGGMYTLLFRKINGQWVIITDHSS